MSSSEELEKGYSRLQEEHAKSLKVTKERTQKWEQFRGDYEALQARLYTLPDQLTHDIMVPFGRFAFMPGKLYHSNEVMVLLGDNWFAKRSVKQALEIAEKRKQYVIKMLEDEKKQLQDWEARMAFTQGIQASQKEHENIVEIKEEYEPPSQPGKRVWKARKPKDPSVPPPRPVFPRARPRPPPSQKTSSDGSLRVEPIRTVEEVPVAMTEAESRGSPQQVATTDEQLWARLDELKREEEKAGPDEEAGEEGDGGVVEAQSRIWLAGKGGGGRGKEVKMVEGRKEGGEGTRGEGAKPIRITVKHSVCTEQSAANVVSSMFPSSPEEKGPPEAPLFRSPGDIFRRGVGGVVGGEGEEEERLEKRGVKWDPQLVSYQRPSSPEKSKEEVKDFVSRPSRAPLAFTGQVIERIPTPPATKPDSTRKVSQFRATRSLPKM